MSLNNFIKVVLPTAKELEGRTVIASDFALGCGVRFREFVYHNATDTLRFTTERNPLEPKFNCAYVATSTIVCKQKSNQIYCKVKTKFPCNDNHLDYVDDRYLDCFVGDHTLGIAPKFVHPKTIDMKVMAEPRYQGVQMGVIKIGDKIPTVPQIYVGSKMSKKLESLMKKRELQQVGTFTVDGNATRMSYSSTAEVHNLDEHIEPITCPRFVYQGVEYVRKNFAQAKMVRRVDQYHDFEVENGQFSNGTIAKPGKPVWFECAPCRAIQNQDGSITCLDVIMPCQIEVESEFEKNATESIMANSRAQNKLAGGNAVEVNLYTDNLSIGKFLNQIFLKEMLHSVGMDLNQVKNSALSK